MDINEERIINDFANKAKAVSKREALDYVENGLLHCGKCHTPKQTIIEVFDRTRTVPCICKCKEEQIEREDKERKRRERTQELQRIGFQDPALLQWRFDADDGENPALMSAASNYLQYFVENKGNCKGLLLFGGVGSGKTFAAACIANALIDMGYSAVMTNFPRIVNIAQGMYEGKQEFFDRLNRCELLILDDMAAERKTEYMQEIVFNVIDGRYRSGKPLIVTTNLTGDEIKHPADMSMQRTLSRLLEMCHPLEVKHIDRRKKKLSDGFAEMQKILGV